MSKVDFSVTLAQLREAGACAGGYLKAIRILQARGHAATDLFEPIPLADVARRDWLNDALWALRCVPGCERDARLFAAWCARQLVHRDDRGIAAIVIAERFTNGAETIEELIKAKEAAWRAVYTSTHDAVAAAAWAAAWAADQDATRGALRASTWDDAWGVARDDAWAHIKDAQHQMFIDMCEGRAPWQ